MGIYTSITNFIESKRGSNPNAGIVFGSDRVQVSMDTNQHGSTMQSRQIQKTGGAKVISFHPVARQLLLRFDIATDIAAGYVAERMAEKDRHVIYDKYTESILAEVMSSQQTESKLESAPSFIRRKKRKQLYK